MNSLNGNSNEELLVEDILRERLGSLIPPGLARILAMEIVDELQRQGYLYADDE